LILDDWGLSPLNQTTRHDLLEIIEYRSNHSAIIITSQLPVKEWHHYIGDPTIADAILDRIVHKAHQLNLKGESLRKLMNHKS
jgi:DNA replication protein DnaC